MYVHTYMYSYTGLHFRAISSQDNCLSLTYGSPVINPTTLDWKVCCEPDEDVGGEYVTYHKLTDVDDSLSAVMAKYAKPNIVGLILINSTNSRTLSYGFINKTLSMPPVYIISSKDGEKLTTFINKYEGVVKIKVYVETPVDTQSLFPSQSSWCTSELVSVIIFMCISLSYYLCIKEICQVINLIFLIIVVKDQYVIEFPKKSYAYQIFERTNLVFK